MRMFARAEKCARLRFLQDRGADEARLDVSVALVDEREIVDAERSLQNPLDAPESVVIVDRRRIARRPHHDQTGISAVAFALEQPARECGWIAVAKCANRAPI